MRNTCGQQGENEWQCKKKANKKNTSNKIFGEHMRQFLHKQNNV